MRFCRYKNILGEVGKGPHSYRIFDIAIIDVLLTIALAKVLQFSFGSIFENFTYWGFLLVTVLIGIVLHRIFCVRTTIDKLLFIN